MNTKNSCLLSLFVLLTVPTGFMVSATRGHCAVPVEDGVIRFGPKAAGTKALALAPVLTGQPVTLTAKTRERADFTSAADWCWFVASVMEDNQTYTRLNLPGLAAEGAIGEPRIPFQGQLVRVPDGAIVSLVIDDVTWVEIEGRFTVEPVQPQATASDRERPAFTRSSAAYARDVWQPEAPVRISEHMRIRGRDFVYVVYTPVAYCPVREALRAATRVTWHLEYALPAGGATVPLPDPQGEAAFGQIFERALDASVPEAYASSETVAPLGETVPGADYVIIVPEEYAVAVLPLAQLKDRMGLTVRLVPLMDISTNGCLPTALEITAFIRNAYQTWYPQPTYLLLVGDTDLIPPYNEHVWPSRPGMPATDLYYAAVDGDDIFPDLFCGRLSCADTEQCETIVNKIVNHQVSPNAAPDFRNGAFIPGQFQDMWWIKDKGYISVDGIEVMRFIETAEALKDYLEFKGMSVLTSYTSDTNVVPRKYDVNSYYHDGASVYIGSQQYLANAVAQARTRQIMNEGFGLVSYHAHGGVGGWDNYNVGDVATLNNGTRLPFVISLTCLTGAFDDPGGPCFAEALLRRSGGGAVAVVACSRVSYQDGNDWSRIGLQEALWPDYLETVAGLPGYDLHFSAGGAYSGYGPRLGQAVNFGKMYYFEKNGSQDGARYHFEVMTLFGDPHMHFQPWNDVRINVTHPGTVSAALADFGVLAVNHNGERVSGANVQVTSAAGDTESYTTDANGFAHVSFAPVALDKLTITVTKDGLIPYVGSILLATEPLTVGHPASVSAVTGGFIVRVYRNGSVPLEGAKVVASSAAGDNQERTTDASGQAVFAFIPFSITTMNITVTKRAYTTYQGTIQMIPGTITVSHDAEIDEGESPFAVTVRTGGQPLQSATVTLSTGQVQVAQMLTPGDGVARFPMAPLGVQELIVRTTARGYTPVNTSVQTVSGNFVWDPLPATLDRGGPEQVRVTLTSALDGSSVITGYTGTASISVSGEPDPPPSVAITDVRRYGTQSFVMLQNVQATGSVSLLGWRLVRNGSTSDIDAVDPDMKAPERTLAPLFTTFYRSAATPGDESYWGALGTWQPYEPGWVMLLDAATNIVDFVAWGWQAEELAAMAPVIGGRTVPLGSEWNGDGVAVGNGLIVLSRHRVENPQDRNVAEDFGVSTAAGAQQGFATPFMPAGPRFEIDRDLIGPFISGVWTGAVAVLELASNVQFRAEDGWRVGESETFDVVQAPHSQYGFDVFTTQKLWNVSFPVTVRAQDRNGIDYTGFNGSARLYGYADATAEQVLITEVGVSSTSANFVELQNLSKGAANTRNWRLLVGDVLDNVSGFDSTVVTLPDSVAAGSLLTGVENRISLPGSPGFPSSVGWANGEPGWVMLLDSSYEIVDFVVWGWQESDITNMAVRVDGHTVRVGAGWVGKGVSYAPGRNVGSLQRKGSVDYNRSSDFRWWTSSRGTQNAWLDYPLTDARHPVQILPTTIGPFTDGIWTGSVTVQEDVDGMYFEVRDALGVNGLSPRFNVRYLGPITVTVPSLTTEGDGVITGRVSVAGIAGLTTHLRSSDTSEITVPATVTIPFGMSSANFYITVVDDAIVDFTQDVEVHASGPGYGSGDGLIGVQDNEHCTITFVAPASTVEGAGTLSSQGDIRLSDDVGQTTTFKLASSDTTEIQVPASVTLASGQRRALFNITVVDDALADGEQTARITVTPDNVLFKTGMVAVADNDAHHFEFRELGNVQTACVPFEVTIRAVDSGGRTIDAYAGRPSLSTSLGVALSPTGTAAFVLGEWVGNVSVLQPCNRIRLSADDGLAQGESTAFDVTHGPLSHFSWTLFPTGVVHAGAWLPARLQACDTNGFPVSSFNGPARIEVTQHDPAHPVRLLTFVRHAQMERGYRNVRAAIDTCFPQVSETLTVTTNAMDLAQELERNDVFLMVAQEDAPSGQLAALGSAWGTALSGFVEAGGVVIACSGIRDEHVFLRNAGLADLMLESAGGGLASPFIVLGTVATNCLTKGVAEKFSGKDVEGFSSTQCDPVVRSETNRVAVVLQRGVGDGQVVMIGYGFSEPNVGFDRILANAVRLGLHRLPQSVPSVPEQAERFLDGVWTGILQIPRDGLDTQVDAVDQAGHRGGIGLFDIDPLRLSGFRLDAKTGLVFEWPSGGVTPYTVKVADGEPDREYVPLETGIQATPPLNTYTGKPGTAESQFYRLSVPQP